MDTYTFILFAIIAAFVAIFWKAAQWAMTSARVARDTESLTPADVEALKEACDALVADLRSAADECTAQVEDAIRRAQASAGASECTAGASSPPPSTVTLFEPAPAHEQKQDFAEALAALSEEPAIPEFYLPTEEPLQVVSQYESEEAAGAMSASSDASGTSPQGSVERIYELADEGLSWEEIARREERDPAEVKLFLSLREMQSGAGNAA